LNSIILRENMVKMGHLLIKYTVITLINNNSSFLIYLYNMKYIITESQLNKAYFKYLDYIFDGVELDTSMSDDRYKVYSTDDNRAFTYGERTKDVYIFDMFVDEFKDMFVNLDTEEALVMIGRWIEYKFGHRVRDVIPVDTMSV
jgi:hypothetical protein